MRHEARLNRRTSDGATERDHLQAAAHRSARARAALEGPECPEELEYLLAWAYALHGRSGVSGMGDLAPLAYTTVEAWARLMDMDIEPHEVEALMAIDAAMRNPGEPEPDETDSAVVPVWPTKRKAE